MCPGGPSSSIFNFAMEGALIGCGGTLLIGNVESF
jgi:hypothetical protein